MISATSEPPFWTQANLKAFTFVKKRTEFVTQLVSKLLDYMLLENRTRKPA